jgi:4a-hydroxytetrahydrobiopterin dehydratase
MTDLAHKRCVPCRGGTPPLSGEGIKQLQPQVPAWEVVDEHHLRRRFDFPDFATALAFVDRIGEIAEQEGHHPDVQLSYGRVVVEIWTHKIDGLTESDFILAAKIDRLL